VSELLRTGIKEFLIPGSLPFLLIGQTLGVVLLLMGARAARWGRRWLVALLCVYLALSLQGTSDLLIYGLSREYGSVWTRDQAAGAHVLVVLSNGVRGGRTAEQEVAVVNLQSAHNALEAARLYRLLGNPQIIVSGGITDRLARAPESAALASALEALGVPHERIVEERTSQTTRQQAVNVAALLEERHETQFVLVTVPEHMRRATGLFARQGLHPICSLAQLRYGGSPPWRPTRFALQGSENAIYEYFAWVFYRIRGWL
jgi:uncharacterized SAM-binding protein YcdF (DUF218 family)